MIDKGQKQAVIYCHVSGIKHTTVGDGLKSQGILDLLLTEPPACSLFNHYLGER
ncbi:MULTISPECIES: hypothetical protein [Rhodomicrobium]|uniref:hypothetical protein n=1 Tax=Rhodomicrobium TaxID=1068 RepID=UPI0014834199|nr:MULTISPECIES: hypothetical protein [Rhodomicrobium]